MFDSIFKILLARETYVHGGDTPAAVDNERSRQRFQPAVLIARLVVAEQYAIVHFLFDGEGGDGFPPVVVHGDTDHLETAIFVLALKFREPGDLDDAGAAPGRPEVEEHDFALVIRQVHHLPLGIFQSEVRRMFPLSVFFNRLFDRPAGRACDHTENRGNAHNGKQTQIGSQTFHQFQLYREYLDRENPGGKTLAKPGGARAAANRREGDFRIDPAQYPCGSIAKTLAAVIAPQPGPLRDVSFRKFRFAPFSGPAGFAASAGIPFGFEECFPSLPALIAQPHPHKMTVFVIKNTLMLAWSLL